MDKERLQQLVTAAQRGDEAAFARLAEEYYRLAYGLAYSTLGNADAAQDVAQDTFVVAWTHLGKLKAAGAFPMWLRKIARNLALNWIRSADYRRRLIERHRQQSNEETELQSGVTEMLEREERQQRIWAALQSLNPTVREAMVLFYLEGCSVNEAASRLEISENALKLRLHTGRAKLRDLFARDIEERLQTELSRSAPSEAAKRILAGLAIGPAVPHIGDAVSGAGWSVWAHHFMHEGLGSVASPIIKGGIAVNLKKAAAVGVAGMLVLGGSYWGYTKMAGAPATSGKNWRIVDEQTGQEPTANEAAPDSGGSTVPEAELAAAAPPEDTDSAPTEEMPSGPASATMDNANFSVVGGATSAEIMARMVKGKIEDPSKFASVSGRVVDTRGQGIAGAVVTLFASGTDLPREPSLGHMMDHMSTIQSAAHYFATTSDGNGAFTITGISFRGRGRVSASAEGFVEQDQGPPIGLVIEPGAALTNVTLVLEPGLGLNARLLSYDGKPVTDATVMTVSYRTKAGTRNGQLSRTNTDADGYFHLAFVREGEVSLVATSGTYGQASFEGVPVGSEDLVELRMEPGATVAGNVTWANGSPATGVLVYLRGASGDGSGEKRVPASLSAGEVDGSGSYSIANVDANQSISAVVRSADGDMISQPEPVGDLVPGGTTIWNYVIEDSIRVYGHVYSEQTGKPMRDIKVACLLNGSPVEGAYAAVGGDGSYELNIRSGAGSYLIYPRLWRIEPSRTGYKYGKQADLAPGQELELDLMFADTYTMSLRVVDAGGQPIEGLMLGVREGDHTWLPVATTPADGRFTWSGFMPGVESNFIVQRGEVRVGNTEPRVGEPGEVYPEETVVLFGNAGVEGYALKSGGALANGLIRVTVFYAEGKRLEREVNTDSEGHFVLNDGLPATSVVFEMIGYDEDSGGVNKYSFGSGEIALVDEAIMDLGDLPFALEESNIDVNEENEDEDF